MLFRGAPGGCRVFMLAVGDDAGDVGDGDVHVVEGEGEDIGDDVDADAGNAESHDHEEEDEEGGGHRTRNCKSTNQKGDTNLSVE